jgi:CDP-diacylglycerol--glycerol-3-phosphate 3-phosphatidyltransferase
VAVGRPWITANQVTLARLIPMPLLSWLIYRGGSEGYKDNPYMWSALLAGIVVGCTDWVDGILARKYGPTVLGGLLDPIADKIFVAFAYTPFVSAGLIPAWMCALMFVREFFVTALRSAYEQRALSLKTSKIAKAKTWTQMQGIGVMLLFPLVDNPNVIRPILIAGIATPVLAMGVRWLVTKKTWLAALWMSLSFAALLVVYEAFDSVTSVRAIMVGVVAITWVSGADYIVGGWRKLRAAGDFNRADAVRLVGSITVPSLVFAALVEPGAASWPLFVILACELAVGGLDNLLSHHKKATKSLAWGSRVLGISALLGVGLLVPAYIDVFTIAAAAVAVVGCFAEFWVGRDYFLDKRIRERILREAPAKSS